MRLNSELLYEQIAKLGLRRLTIDLDGTVIRAGSQGARRMGGSQRGVGLQASAPGAVGGSAQQSIGLDLEC
jgi:hypothetical protein